MTTHSPDEGRVLRVGVAAFGMAAQVFHIPLIQAAQGLELAAVASSRPEAVRQALPGVRVHADALALCDDHDLDLIVVPTPNDTHAPIAEAALKAGKHVVVDKPFALDAMEAQCVLDLARASGLVATVFQNRRLDGDFLTLAQVIRSGRVGRPVQLDSHFDRFRPAVPHRWRDEGGPGAGIWYDLGPHLADQALTLFGPPTWVQGDLAALRDGAVTDDYAHVVLGYDGLRVNLHATTLAAAATPRFVLHGTAGSFVIDGLDPQEAALKAGRRPGDQGWGLGAPDARLTVDGGEEPVPRRAGCYERFYPAVRVACLGQAPPPVSAAEALSLMRVLDAGRESSATGRRVLL